MQEEVRMSIIDGQEKFRELSKERGNTYAAVLDLGRSAKEITRKYNNTISASRAISWLLTGEKPEELNKEEESRQPLTEKAIQIIISDTLASVDDLSVCKAVSVSVWRSVYLKNLVYEYNGIEDKQRMSRVRVLVNMIMGEIGEDSWLNC